MVNEKDWVDILTALLTPTIAIFGALIAFQQWRLNAVKFKHELYDRRLRIYTGVKGLFEDIIANGTTNYSITRKFYLDTAEADFLISDDIRNYIDTLYKKGIKLAALDKKMYLPDGQPNPRLPTGIERNEVADKHNDLLTWFIEEEKQLKDRFMNYLKLH